jgi:hypothetical protein
VNPDVPFSTNGIPKIPVREERKNVPALVIALIAVPLLLLVVVPIAWTIALNTGTPVFATPGEIVLGDIDHFEVRLFNLKASFNPDRKEDDVGPYVAKTEHYTRLLAPLVAADTVDSLPTKAFLGEYRIRMKDGRRQVIRLSFLAEQDGSKRLAFKIGPKAFRGGPVSDLVATAEACDPRPKKN